MRNYIRLFSNRFILTITFSFAMSVIGTSIFNIVLLVIAMGLPNKSLAITLVSIISILPSILQIILGKLASLQNRKYSSLIISKILQSILYFSIALIQVNLNWKFFCFILIINLISDTIGFFNGNITSIIQKKYVDNSLRESLLGVNNVISTFITMLGQSLEYIS